MLNLYKRIWQATGREQILLIVLSIMAALLAPVPLQFQKDIINGLGDSKDARWLIMMSAAYFGVIMAGILLKIVLRYRSALVSKSVVREIRVRLFQNAEETQPDRGTLITKISGEADEVGEFAGEAISTPLLQFGTLASVIAFVAHTQPYLGLLILVLILPQATIVLYMQHYVNERVAERVRILRRATSLISAEDLRKVREEVLADFDAVLEKQRQVLKLKLSIKFMLDGINSIGLAGILLAGGLLYLKGHTDIGTVVASLSAFQRVTDPWQKLIGFYRQLSTVRVGFELLLPQAAQSAATTKP